MIKAIETGNPAERATRASRETDLYPRIDIELCSLQRERFRWEMAGSSAVIDDILWLLAVSEKKEYSDLSEIRQRLMNAIDGVMEWEKSVNGCPETTSANLDRHRESFENALSAIQDNHDFLNSQKNEYERLLLSYLGIEKMLDLKSYRWLSGDFGIVITPEESNRRKGVLERLKGTDLHRLEMLGEHIMRTLMTVRKNKTLRVIIDYHKLDMIVRIYKLRNLNSECKGVGTGPIARGFEISLIVDSLWEHFDDLLQTHREYDDVRELELGFDMFALIYEQLVVLEHLEPIC